MTIGGRGDDELFTFVFLAEARNSVVEVDSWPPWIPAHVDSRLRGNDERREVGMTKEGEAGMTRRGGAMWAKLSLFGGGGVALVILVFFGVYMNVGVAYFYGKWVSGAGFCYGKRVCTGLGWWSGCMDSRPGFAGAGSARE